MRKADELDTGKRRLLVSTARAGLVLAAPALIDLRGSAAVQEAQKSGSGKGDAKEQEGEVTPPEDLMREHGVLDRILLIYDAGLRKFADGQDFDPAVLTEGRRSSGNLSRTTTRTPRKIRFSRVSSVPGSW